MMINFRIVYTAFLALFFTLSANAQRGVHGARTITAANTIVNEYTPLTASAAVNATTISVTNSALNGNGRFATALAPGDLILIIQIQGATILGTLNGIVANPLDSSWGQVTNYNNCGRFEYAQVKSVPNATSIELDCGLQFAYSTGGTNRSQVVRVPRWTTLTVNAAASITADDWNGNIGGIVAVETQGNITLNGTIDASSRGFRGGALLENLTAFGVNNVGSTDATYGAEKGEGIAGYQADYDPMGGRYGRGAAANGGGGGCGHNGGGGGGANGGATNFWRGVGVVDPNAAYTAAWNLDPHYGVNFLTTLTTANSTGGGRGGYCFSDQNANATTLAPSNYAGWGGDGRRWDAGGLGGRPLNYSSGRLFLGGGGGAGDQNQLQGGAGGDGGGLIYVMCYGNLSGTGSVLSNGANGLNAAGVAPTTSYAGRDAAGGGGGGGTIVLNVVGTLTGVAATANGGNGGNQAMTRGALFFGAINEAEGPGGGGGGGHIAISTGAITRTANGGNNGTTNSDALTEFPPNGAMRGSLGTTNATVTNFVITVAGTTTICAGQTATLTAAVTGTPPIPQTILWYAAATGGNAIGSGSSFTTPVLNSTTTYYVGTCPGTYREPITVTVNPLPVPDAGANTTICSGNPVTITATGGGTYVWNGGSLVNAAGASQTVSPAVTTTYTVNVTLNGCSATDQVTVTVNPSPNANAGANASICSGNSTTLTATGGGTYVWNGGTLVNAAGASQTVSPTTSTTYTVSVTLNGCTANDQVTVIVNASPVAAAGSDITLCNGNDTVLTATGGGTYSWNGGTLVNAPGASQTVVPAVTTTYTVTVIAANGCTDTDDILVTVVTAPTAVAGLDQAVCSGSSASLTATGGGTYTWNGGTLVNTAGATQSVSPVATTDYIVTVSLGNGCSDNDTVRVSVNPNPIAVAGADQTICVGATATLTASGGGTYSWNGGALVNAAGASQTVTPTTATAYTVQVTDVNNCSDSDTLTVFVNALPIVLAGNDVSICSSSSTQLSASGAATYVWSPVTGLSSSTIPNPVASPLVTTTYAVTGTDANGCSATDSITVTVTTVLTVSAGADVTICAGDSVQLSTSGGVLYSWLPSASLSNAAIASPMAGPATTTTYTVQVTDANNCQGSDTITVNVNGPVTLTATGTQTICIGQSATLTATPSGGAAPYTYSWSNSLIGAGPHTVSPASTTTYTVSVTDSSGCASAAQSITVTVNPPLNLSVTGTTIICAGGSTPLTASGFGGDGNYTYTWNPGNLNGNTQTVSPTATTTYTVTLNDGCGTPVQTATVTVTIAPTPSVTFASNVISGCAPLCVNFTGQSTANCATSAWDFGDGNISALANPTNCYTTPGTYSVQYICTDANGCQGSIVVSNYITVAAEPVAAITATPSVTTLVIPPGGSQQVCFTDNTVGATAWNWNLGSATSNVQSPCFTLNDTGTFCADLIVANAIGCDDTISYCLRVVNEALFSVPNVFTPNADATNDIFTVTGTGLKGVTCAIFDRWGVKVYSWDAVNGSWDGRTTSGQQATDGVYYYTLQVSDYNDKVIEKSGYVQLIR